MARTSRILNAGTVDELMTETAEAARRIVRAARAVAFVQRDGGRLYSGQSPRQETSDATEPTRALPLVDRDGHQFGALQVWTRPGVPLTLEDEQVLAQIAHCAATVAGGPLAHVPSADASLVSRFARTVHDLRTPLTAMLSWTWALKHGLDGPRAARAIEAIERNARSQARLLDQTAETLHAAMDGASGSGDHPAVARNSLDESIVRSEQRTKETTMEQRLRDVMTTGVETVAPGDTIRYAAEKMEALDVGSLPVCDGERLVGVLTDRDIAIRAVATGRDPNRTAVIETMTPELVCGFEEQPVEEAVDLMREHEIRRLPVVDRSRRLVGIVALADLATRSQAGVASDALEGVSRPRTD